MLTDITYLYYGSGKCAYLSTIKDGCTRQIPSYVLSESLEVPLVMDTTRFLMNNKSFAISKDAYLHDELHLEHCETFEQVKYEIDQYMEYYNNERYQWNLMNI